MRPARRHEGKDGLCSLWGKAAVGRATEDGASRQEREDFVEAMKW
jgi:hypothetical protein